MASSPSIPPSITRTIDALSSLPGIGHKTASRLTYFLLRSSDSVTLNLAQALAELKTKTRLCSVCFNITEEDPCPICADGKRLGDVILVVEEPLDLIAIERTGSFKGRYHVLHGVIRPVEGIGPDDLKIAELVQRVQQDPILEVILATNPTTEGEATAHAIQRYLEPTGVKVTRLARGLATGSDLEYVDMLTLTKALQGRQSM